MGGHGDVAFLRLWSRQAADTSEHEKQGLEMNGFSPYSRRTMRESLASSLPASAGFQPLAPSKYQYSNRHTLRKLETNLTATESATLFLLIDTKMHLSQGENAQFQCISVLFTGEICCRRRPSFLIRSTCSPVTRHCL